MPALIPGARDKPWIELWATVLQDAALHETLALLISLAREEIYQGGRPPASAAPAHQRLTPQAA